MTDGWDGWEAVYFGALDPPTGPRPNTRACSPPQALVICKTREPRVQESIFGLSSPNNGLEIRLSSISLRT